MVPPRGMEVVSLAKFTMGKRRAMAMQERRMHAVDRSHDLIPEGWARWTPAIPPVTR